MRKIKFLTLMCIWQQLCVYMYLTNAKVYVSDSSGQAYQPNGTCELFGSRNRTDAVTMDQLQELVGWNITEWSWISAYNESSPEIYLIGCRYGNHSGVAIDLSNTDQGNQIV